MAALESRLRSALPDVALSAVHAAYVYILDAEAGLEPETLARARSLLGSIGPLAAGDGFFVVPRKGTISPWSSKATDIFLNCGLAGIRRVERGIQVRLTAGAGGCLSPDEARPALDLLHDRMTQGVYEDVGDLFRRVEPAPFRTYDVHRDGREALVRANRAMGLALSDEEIDYLYEAYRGIERNPTDVELLMFGQVNSEHCRHKIFNADWTIDGKSRDRSLFSMIRNTHEAHPDGTLVAYRDNSAVMAGREQDWFSANHGDRHVYEFQRCLVDILIKVETHNHPTAIAPYPGAATGVGGEIRDEAATGTGGKSKGGLSAFMVSNLRVPDFVMPWEKDYAEFPSRLATPLEIMLDGPLGGARFGNEFGRPQLTGLFRTYEQVVGDGYRGYHKPIMVAGGMGNIRRCHVHKKPIPADALIVQIGGPAMRIGLGGGAASSMDTGSNIAALDYDSVQRDNAEMERRCQEVIDACTALGERNPILSIHDIGAGGLSNGCPELVAECGAVFELREIHNEDLSMSPMEIWCCEAQERYVLAVLPDVIEEFIALCRRERCPVAVLGRATGDGRLILNDRYFDNTPIDIDLGIVLGKPPRMRRETAYKPAALPPLDPSVMTIGQAAERVLRLPAVAGKTFLITIADRSITGLVCRDQMVGPYQVPLADVCVTAAGYRTLGGECMAMGERTPIALVSGPASGRMAVGEALTNIAAAAIGAIGNVKLSANWMCASGEPGEDAALYDTVRAVGMQLCPALGVSIPVGKDSLSMRTVWREASGTLRTMTAPLSLVVSAFAPVRDAGKTVTPDLKPEASVLYLLDLGRGLNRLGASALAQVYNQVGTLTPDLDDPALFVRFFRTIQRLVDEQLLLAYHDRSDGGLFATLAEMCIGGRRGADIDLAGLGGDALAALFSEELGAVIQVAPDAVGRVREIIAAHALDDIAHELGPTTNDRHLALRSGDSALYRRSVTDLNLAWSELTFRMQSRRDNPECVAEEYGSLRDETDPGLTFSVPFSDAPPPVRAGPRPRMAILREQGINGQLEMAAAFHAAGFEVVDVHMTDLLSDPLLLQDFIGMVACGGFSYGDVLGAGSGWAKSILFNDALREAFAAFFARRDTFALGVCNGCQMLAQLKDIIPGAGHWPAFDTNRSEQFEARFVTVEILPSPSIFFTGMAGARLGIPVAHGEGRAVFADDAAMDRVLADGLAAVRYVNNRGEPAQRYPANPNGSPGGLTGFTTPDGRVTILMPHPERAFRNIQFSYRPRAWAPGDDSPWLRMFRNAYAFVTAC